MIYVNKPKKKEKTMKFLKFVIPNKVQLKPI